MNSEPKRTVRRPPWDAQGITVELGSDRSIWCYDYHVSSAYHLLEGEPIAPINRECLRVAPEDAKRIFFEGSVHILEPELRKTHVPAEPFEKLLHPDSSSDGEIIQHFPPVRIIGKFHSTAMDQDEHFSYLILIWWQDAFDRIPDDGALARLKSLDWESKAKDYSH